MFSICLFEIQKGFQICLLSLSPTKAINLPLLAKPNHILIFKSHEWAQRPEEFEAPALFFLPNIRYGLWQVSKNPTFRSRDLSSFIWEICFLKDTLLLTCQYLHKSMLGLKRICLDPINAVKRQGYVMLTGMIANIHLKITLNTQLGGGKESLINNQLICETNNRVWGHGKKHWAQE